ncbi:MAG: DUF5312 domain-containing protein [Treponema sp.]|jgi:hypothetical protein|nr:DUF5312 domain-containing protein [Treponema sp.]
MAKEDVFQRLVSDLSLEERKKLLSKLNSQSSISTEPMYPDEKESDSFNLSVVYDQMPWYTRLWYFLLSLLKSSSPEKVYEDQLVTNIGEAINKQTADIFDYRETMLSPNFYQLLLELKDASRFFYNALDMSVNRDKGAFFAFLASLEMSDIHQRLVSETDPYALIQKFPQALNSELSEKASKNIDEILSSISETERSVMYYNARSLHCLKELSSFLFDRLLMAFNFEPSIEGHVCSSKLVKDQLINLNNILFSFAGTPSISLLESLFVFVLQEEMGNTEFDVEAETKHLLIQAESALTTIRQFNSAVPLTKIIRCTTREINWGPRTISGGEDWFVVYRDYWKKYADEQFASFTKNRRRESLTQSFKTFLNGVSLSEGPNVFSESNPEGIPVNGTIGLSFLSAFYTEVFLPVINKILRIILLDGEFFKRENRTIFTETYNDLMKIDDVIKRFKEKISVDGDYGKRFYLAKGEMSSLPIKRKKIQLVTQDANEEIQKIIGDTQKSFKTMIDVLQGIIKREPGSRYDSLSNLSSLPHLKDRSFIDAVSLSKSKLEEASSLLKEVNLLEVDSVSKIGER